MASSSRSSSRLASSRTVPSRRYRALPRSKSVRSSSSPTASSTRSPSAITSRPIPSPAMTPMRWPIARETVADGPAGFRAGSGRLSIVRMAETHQLSRDAHDRLQAELDDLTTRGRVDIARKIEAARELGDLSENGDYQAAKEEQGKMEGRIRQLTAMLRDVEIVE